MLRTFTHEEYADMVYVYGYCNGNANSAVDEYWIRYPLRRTPNRAVFTNVFCELRECGTLSSVHLSLRECGTLSSVHVSLRECGTLSSVHLSLRECGTLPSVHVSLRECGTLSSVHLSLRECGTLSSVHVSSERRSIQTVEEQEDIVSTTEPDYQHTSDFLTSPCSTKPRVANIALRWLVSISPSASTTSAPR